MGGVLRRRVIDDGENIFLVEDTATTQLNIIGGEELAQIVDDATWKNLKRNRNNRDKVKNIIGETIE